MKKAITKKIFAFLMTLSMLMSMCTVAFAEDTSEASDITVNVNSEEVKLAKEFNVTASIRNNYSDYFLGGEFSVSYDASLLSLASISVDNDAFEVEVLYEDDGYFYVAAFLTVSSDSESGILPEETLDFILTFKAISVGNANITVGEAIFLMGDACEDIDLAEASASFDINYPSKISGAALQLGSGIKLAFTAMIPDEYQGAQMCFTQEKANGFDEPQFKNGTATGATGSIDGIITPKYDFLVGVNPDRLGDEVYAYVIYDGIAISKTRNYSVISYCNHAFTLGKAFVPGYTDEQFSAFTTLLYDLIEYGDKAQLYSGYNTNRLVSSLVLNGYTITPTQFKAIDSTDFVLTEGTISDPKISGVSLSLGSNFKLSYKIKATDINGIKIKISYVKDGKTYYCYANESNLTADSTAGVYYLNLIPDATGIDWVYTLTVYDANGNQGRTVSYSVKSYVQSMQNDTSNLGGIIRALYNYGKSAAAYTEALEK